LVLDLLVCYRVKATLPEGALRHIIGLENKVKGNWSQLTALVEALDLYCYTHLDGGDQPRHVNSAVSGVGSFVKTGVGKASPPRPPPPKSGFNRIVGAREGSNYVAGGTTTKRSCYICGSFSHLQNYHAKAGNKTNTHSANTSFSQAVPKRVHGVNTHSPTAVSSAEGANESRCKQASKLAHETFGAQMGILSTCSRLRYNFWWPTITRDVTNYVNACDCCVRRASVTVYDRVSIKGIERSNVAFNHWFVDIAGPLFPNQKVKYHYCFVACDNNTRWPVAFALRSVNSKSIVEYLFKMWSTFGMSQFVSMDNAAYSTSKLTKLLLEKMGCSPIFITSGHSSGNSLAERTIGTVKELIHKVAYDHKRSWWKFLDYILWVMGEVPHSSIGISTWQLALGFTPRGPCAILKEVWTG
jgi:Integrase zinc binding domain